MPFLAYLFIYFYTFSNHITSPMQPRTHPLLYKRINPDPEIPLNLRAGNSIYLYRELKIHFLSTEYYTVYYIGSLILLLVALLEHMIKLFIQCLIFRMLTLVLRNDSLHHTHDFHIIKGLGYA